MAGGSLVAAPSSHVGKMMAATDDPRQRLQRDLEDAYHRGAMDQVVKTLQDNIFEIRASLKDIQETVSTLSKSSVARDEFDKLEVKVGSLSKFQWVATGAMTAVMALLQIIPRLMEFKRGP
jgi:hypothetical protein